MKRHWFPLYLFLMLASLCRAQQYTIDSLTATLANSQADTSKVNLLIAISDAYTRLFDKAAAEKAFRYAKEAEQLAQQLHFDKGNVYAIERQANSYLYRSRRDSGMILMQQILPSAEKMRDFRLLANAQKLIGESLVRKMQLNEGRNYLRLARQNAQKANNLKGEAAVLRELGLSYGLDDRINAGIDTLLQTMDLCNKIGDTYMLSLVEVDLARSYKSLEQFDRALEWARRGYRTSTKSGISKNILASTLMLGALFNQIEQADSAQFYLNRALNLIEPTAMVDRMQIYSELARSAELKHNDAEEYKWLTYYLDLEKASALPMVSMHRFDIMIMLGNYFLRQKRLPEAQKTFESTLPIAEQWQNWNAKAESYLGLSTVAEQTGNSAQALRFFKLHVAARDSLFSEENARKLTRIEMNHEFSQRQSVIKAEQEKQLALRDLQTSQLRRIFGIALLTLLALSALGFYLYRQRQGKRHAELELANLRAQINPHFIFNCLNSIYRYTKERDTDTAAKYLQKFSSLLRLVLENSRSEKIPLGKDLEALKLYADIEGLRFKEKLQFSLEIDPNIDESFVEIPGMLIQPHVENAIWHGLMQRQEGGKIAVRIQQPQENLLRVEIEDNGIGRAAAAELASKSAVSNKSLGQKITAERLRATGKLSSMETIDMLNEAGAAVGTKIILEIPL